MMKGTNVVVPMAIIAGVFGSSMASVTVRAQEPGEPEKVQSVTERPQERYDPLGVRAKSFLIFPKLELSETYNDNIYKSPDNDPDNDFIARVKPTITARSNWNRHALNFRTGADAGFYADHERDNYVKANVGADTRIDATRALTFTGDTSFRRGTEERGGDDVATDANEPVLFHRIEVKGDVKYKPNRFSVSAGAGLIDLNYDDNELFNGTYANNDDRDRQAVRYFGRVGYDILPGYEGYLRFGGNVIEYRDGVDDAGFDRDSHGYKAQAGVAIELTRLLRADIAVGYLTQYYQDTRLQEVNGFSADLNLLWNPTQLMTVRGLISRGINETTTTGVSGTLDTAVGLGMDYEILRNLIATGDAKYNRSFYDAIANDRIDNTWTFSAGLTYKVNRFVYGKLAYEYKDRESNVDTSDYDRNKVAVTLGLQY